MITVQRMFLRDLLPQYGVPSIAALCQRLGLRKQYAWLLWHGTIALSADMMRRLHGELGVPLEALLQVERATPAKRRGRKPLRARAEGSPVDPAEGGTGMTTPDYDTDFYAWTQAQAEAIRAGTWDAVDRAHLAEEVEDVGKSERRALVSHLRVLLTHLLKWELPARAALGRLGGQYAPRPDRGPDHPR